MLARSSAKLLVVADGFLGADYSGMLAAGDRADPGPEDDRLAGRLPRPGNARVSPDWLASGAPVSGGRGRRPDRRDRPRRRERRLLHLGHDRQAEGRRRHPRTRPCGSSRPGARSSACTEGDRYLVVNPFFHTFGYKAGIIACLLRGRDDRARAGLRRARGAAPDRRREGHRAARARRRCTRRSSTAPTAAASTSARCGSRSRARRAFPSGWSSGCVQSSRFATVLTAYGLTESTGTVTHVPAATTTR